MIQRPILTGRYLPVIIALAGCWNRKLLPSQHARTDITLFRRHWCEFAGIASFARLCNDQLDHLHRAEVLDALNIKPGTLYNLDGPAIDVCPPGTHNKGV
jgi:hypothetical protein